MKSKQASKGFTLVEIAIVLVIIGLLLGGILKGQELINNAKVRAIADRQNSLKVAWFSFIDRFAALPGDYVQANIYITGATAGDGNGLIDLEEAPLVFQHMTSAGYLRCPQCTETQTGVEPVASNSLINTYGGVMSIWHDSDYYSIRGGTSGKTPRLMIHTGPRIPSNIIAEVDRKVDDGSPNTGDFSFNYYDGAGSNPQIAECVKQDTAGAMAGDLYVVGVQYWRPANSSPPIEQNCGASVFI